MSQSPDPHPDPLPEYRERAKRLHTIAPPALIALTFVAMAGWTWKTWPHPLTDYGMEPYRAWRLSRGEVLYRDVAHFKGPLSPYVSALWFKLFGESLATLQWANLIALALFT